MEKEAQTFAASAAVRPTNEPTAGGTLHAERPAQTNPLRTTASAPPTPVPQRSEGPDLFP
jgi:hypothetical protein